MFTEVIHICNLHTLTFVITFVIYTSLIRRNHYILCNVQICCIRFSYVDFLYILLCLLSVNYILYLKYLIHVIYVKYGYFYKIKVV